MGAYPRGINQRSGRHRVLTVNMIVKYFNPLVSLHRYLKAPNDGVLKILEKHTYRRSSRSLISLKAKKNMTTSFYNVFELLIASKL